MLDEYTLKFTAWDTIDRVKAEIQMCDRYPGQYQQRQRLFDENDIELTNERRTLSDCGVQPGQTMRLSLRTTPWDDTKKTTSQIF
jgi:hypothetical protein